MEFYEEFEDRRDDFVILAFHDAKAEDMADLESKMAPLERDVWKKSLPFPILMDSTGETLKTFGIRSFPTIMAIDEKGLVVKRGGEWTLRQYLMETSPVVRRLAKKLKGAKGKRKFAKAVDAVVEVGGNDAGFALLEFSKGKKVKKSQIEAITAGLDEVGGLYTNAFHLGDHGLKSKDRDVRLAAAKALEKHATYNYRWTLNDRASEEEDEEVKAVLFGLVKRLFEQGGG